MADTLVDAYQTGDTTENTISSTYWRAQTFTTSSAYDVTKIELKLFKFGGALPGIVTVSLRATSGGNPTGSDLSSSTGTSNGDTLPTSGGAAGWREFVLSTPVALSSGEKYAIVLRCENGTGSSYPLRWRQGSTGYANGGYAFSSNSGVDWGNGTVYDFMFRTYTGAWPDGTIAGVSSLTGAIVMDKYALDGTIAGVASLAGALGTTEAIEGTIAAVASLSGSLLYTGIIGRTNIKTIRRLVAAGNDRIYYEDVD